MNKSDHKQFTDLWISTHAAITYHELPVRHPSINIAFELLRAHPLEVVEKALLKLVETTEVGFMPPPGKVVQMLEKALRPEEKLSDDELLDLAHAYNTPLGLSLIHI